MSKKVLIVEDDVNFRYFLAEQVPWQRIGYEVAGTAVNGQDALDMAKACPVDLVVTDISMPIMNGAELTRRLREQFDWITIVALSAYDNFDYVKETLMAGADDYLLKQNLSAENVLNEISHIEQKKRQKEISTRSAEEQRRAVFYRYLHGQQELSAEEQDYLDHYFSGTSLVVASLFYEASGRNRIRHFLNHCSSSEVAVFFLSDGTGMLIWRCLRQRSQSAIYRQFHDFMDRFHCEAGKDTLYLVSDVCDTYRDLPARVKKLEKAAAAAPYLIPAVYMLSDVKPLMRERDEHFVFEAKKVCRDLQPFDIEKVFARMEETLARKMPTEKNLFQSILNTFSYCTGVGEQIPGEEYARLSELLSQERTLSGKAAAARHFTEEIIRNRHKDVNNDVIRRAIRFVESHYMESGLQVEDVANAVSLSYNYLSNLFSSVTNKSLSRYINEVRIEEAKKLLTDTNLKVYEIAEKVGFNNSSYFSTMFKKITKQPISEYRKSHR